MSTQQTSYPTPCGHVVPVVPSQAGEIVRCPQCGRDVELPSYRDLRQFAQAAQGAMGPATSRPASAPASWSLSQGYQFVIGACLIVAALTAGTYITQRMLALQTEPRSVEEIAGQVHDVPIPAPALWEFWVQIRDDRLDQRVAPDFIVQRELARGYRWWLVGISAVAAIGGGLVVSALRKR